MIRTRLTALAVGFCLALTWSPAKVLAADGQKPVQIQDLHYGEVLFYFYQDEYFPAIVRLLAAQSQSQLSHHENQAELLLGGLYLSYGHHLEAAQIFDRLLADNVNPEVRDRTWFFLAKIWKQRGYLEKAQQALNKISGELPKNLEREAQMLQAQLYIDSGDYDQAISLLQSWKGRTEWASYAKFNLGVALVRSGRVDEAKMILEDLGEMNPFNEETTVLRDKANLALGYALLQDKQPLAAKPVLQRVRLEGPYSSKALLGVGWADAEGEAYQRALVPWMELRNRDLLDPAVQESMLAVPFALAKLDANSQAADHYLNAIEAFDEESHRIDQAINSIETGTFFAEFVGDDPLDSTGWYWRLDELPKGAESRYLFHLLSTHRFQEALKNYRDLSYLHKNLDSWQQSVDVFESMLETREAAYDERLPRVEDALQRADLDGMVDRKLEFDALLNDIEQSHDWLALATAEEFDMWGEISSLESTPALSANIPEAKDVRDKIALLKGVLQWNLEKEFKDRLWRVRSDLQETGEALVDAQRARRQIDESMRRQPLEFADFSNRVYGLAPRIESLKIRIEDDRDTQLAFLQSIAVGELQAQQERLETYTVQARFALATIYDLATTVGEVSE
ncbi:MAG TPA: tetratricopeptide repeat protein [Woeseiaceae bacterium]|nr:tetratricopeptide repeat protein [Woeseiaceae bacterium]